MYEEMSTRMIGKMSTFVGVKSCKVPEQHLRLSSCSDCLPSNPDVDSDLNAAFLSSIDDALLETWWKKVLWKDKILREAHQLETHQNLMKIIKNPGYNVLFFNSSSVRPVHVRV